MKKLIIYLFPIAFVFGMISCQKPIDLDLFTKSEPILVVEGQVTTDTMQHIVKLSLTNSYYDTTTLNAATGAIVSINNVALVESNNTDSAGFYYTPADFYGEEGKTYNLEISYNNKNYTSSSYLAPLPQIDSVTIGLNVFQFFFFIPQLGDTAYDLTIHYNEPDTLGNTYLFNVYIDGELTTTNPRDKVYIDDEGAVTGPIYFSAQSFVTADVVDSSIVTLEMLSISPDLIKFYDTFFNQTDLSGNPFAGSPPANIPTNITGGAVGFFQASAARRISSQYIVGMP